MDYTSKEEKNPNEAASEDTEDKQQTFPHSFESYQKEEVAKLQGVPAPGKILVRLTGTNYVTLAWNSPDNISTFELTCFSPTTTKTYTVINATATEVEDLCPGTEYRFSLVSVSANGDRSLRSEVTACTRPVPPDKFKAENVGPTSVTLIWDASGLLPNGIQSKEAVTYAQTKTNIQSLLQDLGLEQHYPNKLTLKDVLQIDMRSVSDEPAQSPSSLPWLFLKKLMMCMFMLWAMRDIVKKFRPHSLSHQKGFVEERIVHSELPLVTFVRLGNCSISKSQILNKLLSNPQQYHDTFVHRDMDCGDVPRKISNGLVEMGWYLPCGNKNIDVFPEPVAVANLRGDIRTFETQYSFLCQTSTAVFVFFDNLDTNYKLLTNQHAKAQFFLVGNRQSKTFDVEQLKRTASEMSLKKNHVILKNTQNDANFVKNLHSTVNYILNNLPDKTCLEGMDAIAHELGIQVDEDVKECQKAKNNAHFITEEIQDTMQFKQDQLPLQGKIWKDLAKLEKEECRLRKAGDQNIETYKSDLQIKKTELRKQQSKYDISEAMSRFISALTSTDQERFYFLKWMRMNLDNLSRKSLFSLREQYKEKCQQFLENKEEIAQLDQQISNSSLGIEHFLREMGQLYEAAVSLPENVESHKQMLHLPRLCAQLMLDGFPLELVDGDASNIPLRWKDMHAWLTGAETRVSNFEILKLKADKSDLKDLLCGLKQEAVTKLDSMEKTTMENLSKYFEQSEGHVCLVEKYKQDFVNSVKCLRRETESSLLTQLEATVDIRRGMTNLDNIKKTFTDTMEKKVLGLLEDLRKNNCSKNDAYVTDNELDRCFEHIWQVTVSELSFNGLEKKNIFDCVFSQLRRNLKQKGSSVAEKLMKVNLNNYCTEVFKVTKENFIKKLWKRLINDNSAMNLQNLADDIIDTCFQVVREKIDGRLDYHDTYTQEIINIIDDKLMFNKNIGFSDEFELSLKLHICGLSAKEFQNMHDCFIMENDPLRCLGQYKEKYRNDFKDLFHDRDQCQRKAEEFTKLCLIPAVEAFIYSSLGPDIVDKMIQGKNAFQFSTRGFFQYTLLQQLLREDAFEQYVKYISSYEHFVKGWISDQITKQFSNGHEMSELEERYLRGITTEILEAVKMAQNETYEDGIKGFIQCICRKLGQKLVIPKDALEIVMVLNNASQDSFACWLTKSVEEIEQTLQEQLKKINIKQKLSKLKMKPQDELFKRVFGCGKQCPFCKTPCEAGGEAHSEHCASVHRPQGLGFYINESDKKLVTDICSTDVHSEQKFKCFETNYEYHPYKKYREIFPDWHIPADVSIQASDYWKYVMARFNTKFAEEYNARPADIPFSWKLIKKEQAEKSLKESFSIK
ncbi:hypothetical protein QQF64_030663 [Cirrhinus molitorella]|uniref:Fibronectin type-III domain-containing protein n=1 Tax=Cirrhinus molitorella TaxID=172907 RepID=A0ABR3N4A5_9TELE